MVSFADYFFLYSLAISVFYFGCGNCYWPDQGNDLVPVNTNIRTNCRTLQGSTLRIEGNNVKLSDFLRNNQTCFGLFNNKAIKKLDIFAINQVYLDVDIEAEGRELDVSIIASNVRIIDNRRINLRGSDGKKINTMAIPSRSGNPGLPGNPGGNFLLIADTVIAIGYLNIYNRGGYGSRGQDGGDGKNSGNADTSKFDNTLNFFQNRCNAIVNNSKIGTSFECTSHYYPIVEHTKSTGTNISYTYGRITIFNSLIPAENGGDGGRGGDSGKPGKSTILQIGLNVPFIKKDSISFPGAPGNGGKGGKGGSKNRSEYDYKISYLNGKSVVNFKQISFVLPHLTSSDGRDGINGRNTKGFIPARQPRDPRAGHTINEYMSFVFRNFGTEGVSVNRSFLEQLCLSKHVGDLHDSLSLTEEFIVLDKNVYFLSGKFDFVLCYKSLLTRISNYASTQRVQHSPQDKKLLSYLYTATLSKIHHFNKYSETRLIIDLDSYLRKVEMGISDLKDLKKEDDKLRFTLSKMDQIETFRKEYKQKLDDKINDAMKLMKEFEPEMKAIETDIDAVMHNLLNDIKKLESSTETNIEKLKEKKRQLQKELAIKITFGVIAILSAFLLFLGPIGIAAFAVITAVSAVTQSMVLSGGTDMNLGNVTASLRATSSMVTAMQTAKKERLEALLDKLSTEVSTTGVVMPGSVMTRIQLYKTRVSNVMSLKESYAAKEELLKELQSTRASLISAHNPKYSRVVNVINKCVAAAQVIESSYNLYKTIKDDMKKMEAVDEAIQQSYQQLDLLKILEKNFNDVIIPSVEDMEDDMHGIISNLDNKSKVSLLVTKWNVQQKIRKLKSMLHNSTSALPSNSKIEGCMKNLEIMMETIIDIFDTIQSYEEDKDLADYIADLSSVNAQHIRLNDNYEFYRKSLDMVISSNVILQEYGLVVNSFKQFAFPIADRYFNSFSSLPQFKLQDEISCFVTSAKQKIEHLRSDYLNYVSTISEYDRYIFHTRFNSESIHSSPFYKWTKDESNIIIEKLFSGKEVRLMVDVKRSPIRKEAIKFQKIKLHFNVSDESLNSEIHKKLNRYMIHMEHFGDSHYRFNGKIYKIQTDIFEFSYSHETDPCVNEERVYSESWRKLRRSQLMLSPYALWKIQLRDISTDSTLDREQTLIGDQTSSSHQTSNPFTPRDLQRYMNNIELELVGIGSYIENIEGRMNFNEDNYYKPIEILPNKTSLSTVLKRARSRRN